MGLTRLCRRVLRACRPKARRRPTKRPKRPKYKHKADTPPQNGSCLLLALPVEIRLRILGFVLSYNNPIQARENIKPKKDHSMSYYDSSARSEYDEWPRGKPDLDVLRTCRQLHVEGTEIFYRRNTFGITVYDPGYGQQNEVDVVGLGPIETAFARLPRLKDCPKFKFTFVLADIVYCQSLGQSSYKDAIDGPILEFQQRWQRCDRLDVEIIQRNRQWCDHQMGGSALFHKLGLLRCKAIWFRGVPFAMAYRLTQLIESDRPVFDLQHSFRQLAAFMERTYMRDDHMSSLYDETWQAVELAAIEYDEPTFLQLRRQIIETAIARMLTSMESLVETGNLLKDRELVSPRAAPAMGFDIQDLMSDLQLS